MMNKQERLRKYVIETVDKMNINRMRSDTGDLTILATMVGPLHIQGVYANENGCSILMQFEHPDRASYCLNCNPHSGEWHIQAKGLTDAKYLFNLHMGKLKSLR